MILKIKVNNIVINNVEINNEEYTVIYKQRKMKRTLIKVIANNTVKISSYLKLSEEKLKELFFANLEWIVKTQSKKIYLNENEFMLKGEKYILHLDENLEECVFSGKKLIYNNNSLNKLINEELQKIYVQFKMIASNFGKVDLKFRKMKSRWGVCNWQKRVITLNQDIVILPEELILYIIYHELVHLKIHNHQKEFYLELQKYLPNYKILMLELKKYTLA